MCFRILVMVDIGLLLEFFVKIEKANSKNKVYLNQIKIMILCAETGVNSDLMH